MNEEIGIKTISKIKRGAKEKLKGNWGIAILLTFLATVITNAFSFSGEISNLIDTFSAGISSLNGGLEQISQGTLAATIAIRVGMIINLMIGGSITYGVTKFFIDLTRREKLKVETLFSGFKYFGKNFLIQLIVGIFSFLWALAVWIPAIILISIIALSQFSTITNVSSEISTPGGLVTASVVVLVLVLIICAILTYVLITRYAMSYYISVDNPDLTVMECINASKEMMQGNKVRLLLLQLSFIGWHILSILTIFIGYLWLIPYINAAVAEFYNNLKEISQPIIEEETRITLEKSQDAEW